MEVAYGDDLDGGRVDNDLIWSHFFCRFITQTGIN
jgi:hypothetical protein